MHPPLGAGAGAGWRGAEVAAIQMQAA